MFWEGKKHFLRAVPHCSLSQLWFAIHLSRWISHGPSLHCRKEMILQILSHEMEKYVSFTQSLWIKLPLCWAKNAKGSLVVWIRSLINTFKNIYINVYWLTNSLSTFHKNFFSTAFGHLLFFFFSVHCVHGLVFMAFSWLKEANSSKRTRKAGWGRRLELRKLTTASFLIVAFSPEVLFQHTFFFLASVTSLLKWLF